MPQPGKSKVKLTSQSPAHVELLVSASQVACVPLPESNKTPDAEVVFNGESVIPDPDVPAGL